ncbi:MAG: helix-turn-helix transcriptional regulator [Lentisphaeria bacterium]|nr:helix-turn-helix transcriptional regulator [Lentisphaeria bacterium]
MKYFKNLLRSQISLQPAFRLVDLFEESVAYERLWRLPFNSLSLCIEEDPNDPSWVELPEKKRRIFLEKGVCSFTACDTPMKIRYTTANIHRCIHFRYELFPGVDLFSGMHDRVTFKDESIVSKITQVFAETDPLRRVSMAESAALETVLKLWPEHLPLVLEEMAAFNKLFDHVRTHLDSQLGITEMAGIMGWSEGYFSRTFRRVFNITPKQYLIRELFARASELLNDPQKSIKQIAYELRFSSEFNFSRFIRRYSGHSPSELRKNINGSAYVRK